MSSTSVQRAELLSACHCGALPRSALLGCHLVLSCHWVPPMSSSRSSQLLLDSVVSPPPDRLLYWLLQYCTFEGLSLCRSELRSLLSEASERQLQSDVERIVEQRSRTATGRARGKGGASNSSERQALYSQLSAARDSALATVDSEVAVRVKLRHLYRAIVECSYEHAMGLSTWLAELREVCESAGLPLTSDSSLFRLQLAAIGNMAVRAADRPRTSKADFDQLMKHLMTYAAVTEGNSHSIRCSQPTPHAAHRISRCEWHGGRC